MTLQKPSSHFWGAHNGLLADKEWKTIFAVAKKKAA